MTKIKMDITYTKFQRLVHLALWLASSRFETFFFFPGTYCMSFLRS
jgi:hypothetical protein